MTTPTHPPQHGSCPSTRAAQHALQRLHALRRLPGHHLLTCSNHIALPARDQLIADITRLIDTRYDGQVVKRYLAQLATATRR